MGYYLADGSAEGEHLGLLPVATTIAPETAIESYLSTSIENKTTSAIPSPRTAPSLQVAPSTAAAMVADQHINPTFQAAVSAFMRTQQGVETTGPSVGKGGAVAAIAGALFLLWVSARLAKR